MGGLQSAAGGAGAGVDTAIGLVQPGSASDGATRRVVACRGMTTITRDELYSLVWSEPIQKLAKRFNISDRGLTKVCERHGIPTPERGWWARKAAGRRVKQPLLPPIAGGQSERIRIEGQQQQTPKTPPAPEVPLKPEIAFERDPANFILVDPNARLTHPLIRDAATALREARPSYEGIRQTPRGCIDIRVSKDSISRALRIYQAFLNALKARGYIIEIKEGKTHVTVLGESVQLYLRERLTRKVRDLTPEEHKRRREGIDVNPYVTAPKGELAFYACDYSPDVACGDGKKQRLEESLNRLMEWLVNHAYQVKARRHEREREAERERIVAEQRAARRRHQREYEALLDRFDKLAAAYEKTERRRAFLDRLREAVGDVAADSPLGEWLRTAASWVELSDPLKAFRERGEPLKLYAHVSRWELGDLRRNGFKDPELSKEHPPGVALSDTPKSDSIFSSDAVELELPAETVLPFETTAPGYEPRTFYVPARVLNQFVRRTLAKPQPR